MNRLSRRVERLECQPPAKESWSLGDLFERMDKLRTWLKERGHADATNAVEAGVKCPVGMEDVWDLSLRVDAQRRCSSSTLTQLD